MSEGQEAGDCMELTLYFTAHTIHFSVSLIGALVSFRPRLLFFLTLSAITLLFIGFQPSVSAPIKWLEVAKLWAGLYEGASRENLSLWHCNRNTGFLT